jgi:beta-lactam-binding protein with PASTA domain
MGSPEDDRIVKRLQAAGEAMSGAPVDWDRIAAIARRKAIVLAVVLLAAFVAITLLLTFGGSYGALKVTGATPVSLPGVTTPVPDVHGESEARAAALLKRAGLLVAVSAPCASRRGCVVAKSKPAGGANVTSGAKVSLVMEPRSRPLAPAVHPVHAPAVVAHGPSPKPRTTPTGKHLLAPGRPAQIAVSVTHASIAADGKSTTTIEATVLDARGDQLKGQRVTFTSSEPGEPIAMRFAADAVSVATVTSSKRPGELTIEAHDGAVVKRIEIEQTPVEEPARTTTEPLTTSTSTTTPASTNTDSTTTSTSTNTTTPEQGTTSSPGAATGTGESTPTGNAATPSESVK